MLKEEKKIADLLKLLDQVEHRVESLVTATCRLGAELQRVGELRAQLPDLDSLTERCEAAARLATCLEQSSNSL
ncbi:MAG: hypothetical protein J0M17_10795 [Planctomycetes bacterium]|nr:hypothetical protein [Planctomycetota bacterium]